MVAGDTVYVESVNYISKVTGGYAFVLKTKCGSGGWAEHVTIMSNTFVNGAQPCCGRITVPQEFLMRLLNAAKVRLPEVLPCKGIQVAIRKKLPDSRTSC